MLPISTRPKNGAVIFYHSRALPVPVHGAYAHATGLCLWGDEPALALSHRLLLPSPPQYKVGAPEG